LLAVTTGFAEPMLAPDPLVRVSVELPFPGAATFVVVKLAFTPVGNPEIERAIAELKPPKARVLSTSAPLVLDPTDTVVVLAERLKPGTFTLNAIDLVIPPPVAVTVNVQVPGFTFAPAVTVKMLLPVPGAAILAGANCAVIPAGSPLIVNATVALNVEFPVVVNVTV